MCRIFGPSLVALVLLAAAVAPCAADTAPPYVAAVDRPALETSAARTVRALEFDVAGARFTLDEGVLVPARRAGERVLEVVFAGKGHVGYTPADEVERGQLKTFSGQPVIDVPITAAVFVPGETALDPGDAASAPPAPDLVRSAESAFAAWARSPERTYTRVLPTLIAQAAGDATAWHGFAAWFPVRGKNVLFRLDPASDEPVTLEHFEPWKLTELERWKRQGAIASEKADGHGLDNDPRAFGTIDTWVSTMDGAIPGRPTVEAEHYETDLTMTNGEAVTGRARLRLRVVRPGVRAIVLAMFGDLRASTVATPGGAAIPFAQRPGTLLLFPDRPLGAGDAFEAVVTYAGALLRKEARGIFNQDRLLEWYPQADAPSGATYECTFRWPRRLQVVASGRVVAGGDDGDLRWERRVLDLPSDQFGFEMGSYEFFEKQQGHVKVRLAQGRRASSVLSEASSRRILDEAASALEYMERTFGAYPFDELTLATTSFRTASHAVPGLVTLVDSELDEGAAYWRIVIAHEIAHQWWGLLVRPRTYRDHWLSEGMAEFAALSYGRAQYLATRARYVSPTALWWDSLVAGSGRGGRPLSWFGSITLGDRIDSSLCRGCATPIVYAKGAMVLDLIALQVGRDAFTRDLAQLAADHRGRTIDTAEFLAGVAARHTVDLGRLAQQYVYGVGVPLLVYSYEYAQQPDGTWNVRLHVEELADDRRAPRITKRPDGTFDVAMVIDESHPAVTGHLLVPYLLDYYRADDPSLKTAADRRRAETVGNYFRQGELDLAGTGDSVIRLAHRPVRFRLDPDRSIPAPTFDLTANPKGALLLRAEFTLARGKVDEAEDLARRALAARVPETMVKIVDGEHGEGTRERWDAATDGRTWRLLGEIALARDDVAGARAALREARSRPGSENEALAVFEGRLLVRTGEAKKAAALGYRRFLDGEDHDRTGYALVAVAALAARDEDLFRQGVRRCHAAGIEVSMLPGADAIVAEVERENAAR